jgi:hypothetical protein
VAAVVEDRVGDRAHDADGAAAIDEPDLRFGEDAAEFLGGLDEGWIGSGAGAAIDADRPDLVQINLVHLELCGPATWGRQAPG